MRAFAEKMLSCCIKLEMLVIMNIPPFKIDEALLPVKDARLVFFEHEYTEDYWEAPFRSEADIWDQARSTIGKTKA